MLKIAVGVYVIAIVAANFLVSIFGPVVTPINAFVFIGLDLALRNWLNLKLNKLQMGAMIFGTGVISYLLNDTMQIIAIASAVSFTLASLVDWFVFNKISGEWMKRANVSNTAGALVDSLVFPTIAFGSLMPEIVVLQFVAKVTGGFVWTYLLRKKV
jgi:queuosine precursor transporter